MKELLVVASAVLVLTLMLSIPVEALQGKHLDAAISNLPSEKFQKSHKKFRMFDKNHDHHIDSAELSQGLASLGHHLDKEKLDKLFSKLDLNGDDLISFKEFLRPIAVKHEKNAKDASQKAPVEPEMKEINHAAAADKAMEIFDQNGDGQVDSVEFFEVVKRANTKDKTVDLAMVQDFIESYADVDGDGKLAYDELDLCLLG